MDGIKFIPKSQQNIEELLDSRSENKDNSVLYTLIILFLIYTVMVIGAYWIFVVQEKVKVTQAIEELDSINKNYYITDNLDQDLFNVSDLIKNFYDPVEAIKSIESAYIQGASVSGLSYNKVNKSVSLSMTVLSLNDTTKQLAAFQSLPLVNGVNSSEVTSNDEDGGFSFNIQIILK